MSSDEVRVKKLSFSTLFVVDDDVVADVEVEMPDVHLSLLRLQQVVVVADAVEDIVI